MPPRTTRSKAATTSTSASSAAATTAKYAMPTESAPAPQLFVLPKRATKDARVVTLPHPRYAARPTRYLVCPETGVYEFTCIANPERAPYSWLITDKADKTDKTDKPGDSAATATAAAEPAPEEPTPSTPAAFDTLTTKSADLYVASPVDPLFLVLPALAGPTAASGATPKRMFLEADDHLDALPQQHSHLADVLRRHPRVRRLFAARMGAVCDTVEAGDEPMFRLNEAKLARELLSKARRMAVAGLPRSMEERFVRRVLQAPVMGVRVESSSTSAATAAAASASTPSSEVATPSTESADSVDSQSTAATAATAATEITTAESPAPASAIPPAILMLQRLRTAVEFLCSSYLPPALAASVRAQLATVSPENPDMPDFAPLDAYLEKLAKMRQEVALAQSTALDYSRKRGAEEEDDERAEKRRKREEEEKRKKAGQSRGVRDLKKVNVTGMKKMSDFFKKK